MYIWKFWYKINVIKNYYGDISYAKAFSQFNKPLRFILNATYFKKSFSCSQSDSNGNSVQRRLYPSLWLSDCWNSSPPKKLGPPAPNECWQKGKAEVWGQPTGETFISCREISHSGNSSSEQHAGETGAMSVTWTWKVLHLHPDLRPRFGMGLCTNHAFLSVFPTWWRRRDPCPHAHPCSHRFLHM